jgi:hypothetical protein
MTPLTLLVLFGCISSCFATGARNFARVNNAIIPSVSPTRPAQPSATADQKRHSKHVNDFYKAYGWLKPNTTVAEKDLPRAIRKIQKALKEPVDGVFSDKMMDIMTKPRCGVEEPYNATSAEAPPDLHKRYVLWGSKWPKSSLTWRFASYSNDVSQAVQQSIVRSVLLPVSKTHVDCSAFISGLASSFLVPDTRPLIRADASQ